MPFEKNGKIIQKVEVMQCINSADVRQERVKAVKWSIYHAIPAGWKLQMNSHYKGEMLSSCCTAWMSGTQRVPMSSCCIGGTCLVFFCFYVCFYLHSNILCVCLDVFLYFSLAEWRGHMVCGCLADAPTHWLALHLRVTVFTRDSDH